jgi:tRNA pseudouridine55 synthase
MSVSGVLIVDKAAGMTSHDVVARVRRLANERSVGHLGTLDPMATGVLPLVLGRMTRLAQFYSAAEKAYEGEIRFGFATDTYDAEGEPVGQHKPVGFTLEQLRAAAAIFRGAVEQVPPPFSAKKIGGVPAYKLAREKKDIDLKPIKVEIREFEILHVDGERASFQARVASGTYLRSVAHDLGQLLGVGAHLATLRRTRVAEFGQEDAHMLEKLEVAQDLETMFVHPRRILPEFPSVTAAEDSLGRIRNGMAVNLPEMSRAPLVKVYAGQAELVCIASRVAGTLFHPKVVLARG